MSAATKSAYGPREEEAVEVDQADEQSKTVHQLRPREGRGHREIVEKI